MDTKKLVLAVVLSVAVIMIYQYFFVKPLPRQAPQTGQPTSSQPAAEKKDERSASKLDISAVLEEEPAGTVQENGTAAPITADQVENQEREISVETDLFTAVFTNKGAGLKSFILKKYNDDQKKPLNLVSDLSSSTGIYPFYFSPFEKAAELKLLNGENFLYQGEPVIKLLPGQRQMVTFTYANKEKNLYAQKTFVFTGGSYVVQLECQLSQDGKKRETIPLVFGPDLENNISKERTLLMNLKIAAYNGSALQSLDFVKIKTLPTANPTVEKARGDLGSGFIWAAYETTYFAAMFKTNFKSQLGYEIIKEKAGPNDIRLYSYFIVQNPKTIYLGPKEEGTLAAIAKDFPDANKVIEYGWFGSLAKLMLKGIKLIHSLIPNYGWAIIFFTLFLKIILFPLTYSSSISMAKMQTLQPKLKAIRKKYKNTRDPEQRRLMNMEVMALYKQEKVNPAGGCLPMLLQLPILWGFFQLLRVSINVRHEPWLLWITDLSKKDPIYLLPILMGVTQLIVQKMTPSGGDETQKKLMYIMPVLMVVLFASFPSGLNLYWLFSNVLQIGQQQIINEKIHHQKKEEEKERKIIKRKKGAKEK